MTDEKNCGTKNQLITPRHYKLLVIKQIFWDVDYESGIAPGMPIKVISLSINPEIQG